MSLNRENLARKYEMMPDPQKVEYRRRSGSSDTSSNIAEVEFCEKRWPRRTNAQSSQQYTKKVDLIWHVWRLPFEAAFAVGEEPRLGDHIVHEGELWVVNQVTKELQCNRFRLSCVRGKGAV